MGSRLPGDELLERLDDLASRLGFRVEGADEFRHNGGAFYRVGLKGCDYSRRESIRELSVVFLRFEEKLECPNR